MFRKVRKKPTRRAYRKVAVDNRSDAASFPFSPSFSIRPLLSAIKKEILYTHNHNVLNDQFYRSQKAPTDEDKTAHKKQSTKCSKWTNDQPWRTWPPCCKSPERCLSKLPRFSGNSFRLRQSIPEFTRSNNWLIVENYTMVFLDWRTRSSLNCSCNLNKYSNRDRNNALVPIPWTLHPPRYRWLLLSTTARRPLKKKHISNSEWKFPSSRSHCTINVTRLNEWWSWWWRVKNRFTENRLWIRIKNEINEPCCFFRCPRMIQAEISSIKTNIQTEIKVTTRENRIITRHARLNLQKNEYETVEELWRWTYIIY